MNTKKATIKLLASLMLIGFSGMTSLANAQIFTYTGTSTSTATTTTTTVISSTSSASSSSSPLPTPVVVMPTPTSLTTPAPSAPTLLLPSAGFMQVNNLIVNSIDSLAVPATIVAMAENTSTVTCESFTTAFSTVGMEVACPSSVPFTIQTSNATQLLLKDRTQAVVPNITAGDIINVFGYYDGSSTIQADIVRDLSKPVTSIISTASTTGLTSGTIASIEDQIAAIQILLGQLVQQVNNIIASSTSSSS